MAPITYGNSLIFSMPSVEVRIDSHIPPWLASAVQDQHAQFEDQSRVVYGIVKYEALVCDVTENKIENIMQ